MKFCEVSSYYGTAFCGSEERMNFEDCHESGEENQKLNYGDELLHLSHWGVT